VVTLFIAWLYSQKFYVLPTEHTSFATTAEQTATFALYNINRLIFYNRGVECSLRGTHLVLI